MAYLIYHLCGHINY